MLEHLSDAELLAAIGKIADQNKLQSWDPYPWQRDFHDSGIYASQRMLMCANGVGKSQTVCAELAMHATGWYPRWWKGCRFDKGGFEVWIGSIDNDMQKRGPQRALLGRDEDGIGTGLVPANSIVNVDYRQAGVKSVADTVTVRHLSGLNVTIKWLTFEQGWRKWQSGDPKIIVWDEEPDENNVEQADILDETLTRLVRNNGIFMVGYTPLLGETKVTMHFMNAEDARVRMFSASWDDAPHMNKEQRELIAKQYSSHQIATRTTGVPMLGEGRIFVTPDSQIMIDPIGIPDHWARINGIDFGLAHPAALACLAWDRDTDTVYLYDCWRKENVLTDQHAKIINGRGEWIPVAWPHDGEKRDPKSGEPFHQIYANDHHVRMLAKSARYKNDTGGAQAQWPIIELLRQRIESGKFKVFRTCRDFLQEYNSYHLKDGKIVAKRDDVLKASFYALMMLRYAVSRMEGDKQSFRHLNTPAPFTTAVH